MKSILLASLLFGVVTFTGCTASHKNLTYTKDIKTQKGHRVESHRDTFIDYQAFSDEAMYNIFKETKLPAKIIVTDFVDVTSLDNHTKLGYVLSNNIKNSLINNYKANVVEAEVSKYFKISGNGLKILSRDVDKLRATNFNVQYAVVGTYTHSDNELIVFVKYIDLKSGIIKGSYTQTFPMGQSTKSMLSTK